MCAHKGCCCCVTIVVAAALTTVTLLLLWQNFVIRLLLKERGTHRAQADAQSFQSLVASAAAEAENWPPFLLHTHTRSGVAQEIEVV